MKLAATVVASALLVGAALLFGFGTVSPEIPRWTALHCFLAFSVFMGVMAR